jgi:hypothetical protein
MNKDAAGRYASVNGLKMYYEIHGAGEPLVTLHGGVGASEMFGPILPVLAERRQVIAVHLQAQRFGQARRNLDQILSKQEGTCGSLRGLRCTSRLS